MRDLPDNEDYLGFLRQKVQLAESSGFEIDDSEINPLLKPHQKAIVKWMVRGGRRACFAAFGLGKSMIQIEVVRITQEKAGGMGLITLPLNVRQEFINDAHVLATGDHPDITDAQRAELKQWQAGNPSRIPQLSFIRRIEEAADPAGIYLTNYETVRDGKLEPRLFSVASLDEASCLRGFGGTKTFREFMGLFAGDYKTMNDRIRSDGVKYRYVATATPSPNDYIELLAYSAFLGIMDVSQAKTRYFKRNSEKADQLTIHPHKEQEFWMWVASWGLFVNRPSDLGFSDEGYVLPELDIRWHVIPSDHTNAGVDMDGQGRMFKEAAIGVVEASREKRESLNARITKMLDLRKEDPLAHRIIWHDLEAERHAIEKSIPGIVSVYGSQDLDSREQAVFNFSNGFLPELAGKPSMLGSGCNLQRHCHWAIYLGIGFKFNDLIQSIHRLQRFLQKHRVRIDLIYTEAEREVRRQLERKWKQHNEQVRIMGEIIRKYGLSNAAMAESLTRTLGVERVEVKGDGYTLINNDCVIETRNMKENSVDLIVTSIPFSTQYEYSPNYADFGHSDNNDHFFRQMDYLVPELFRVLKPGRIAAIHVKDRIVPGGLTGLGFQTLYRFHSKTADCFEKHGFGHMGMKTIVTDVVRENNQTYRLGWTEQCKDATKMGCGVPEYLLLFRKPPTDTSDSYADEKVKKSKPLVVAEDGTRVPFEPRDRRPIVPGTGYSRARWQIDAHGFTRSSGNRLLTPEELEGLPHERIFKMFRDYSLHNVYDFEHHVKIGEAMEAKGTLPSDFMLLQPQSWHPDVWTDITRMLTLNGAQSAAGKEGHLCPLQFDIVDRAIEQLSMPGETVMDPFGGLMTVPYRAIKLKRKAIGIELNSRYFLDGAAYCEAMARQMAMPDLFAFEQEEVCA
ncbi:DNA methyltransferase [Nitrosospira multiformis]|nr:DNA methyltransferase [Nitrosospira multiformis]